MDKELRLRVAKRDAAMCCWPLCGKMGEIVHHIIARGMGGTTREEILEDERNLIVLCNKHHRVAEAFKAAVMLFRILHLRWGYDYTEPPFAQYEQFFDDVLEWFTVRPGGWRLN